MTDLRADVRTVLKLAVYRRLLAAYTLTQLAWSIGTLALADRVAIIKDGRILIEGAPGSLGENAGAAYRVAYRDGDGRIVEQQTDDPTTLLHELTGAALARGERLDALTVTRPTLEDVYLELTAEDGAEPSGLPVEAIEDGAGVGGRRGSRRGRRGRARR